MKLEWMEPHRSLIEKMIRCGNIYAYTFHKQRSFGTESMFSASQIQTLEYIIETMENGLLEKFHCEGNQKIST